MEEVSDVDGGWQFVRFTKCCTNQEAVRTGKCRKQSLSGFASVANQRLLGRNLNAVHVSFWEGVKSEGKFSKVVQRSPTVLGTKETLAMGTASLLMGWPSYQPMKTIRGD